MKSLIVCADDYAQSPAIDAGIIQLIQQNRLSAASCMVLSPRWAEAAKSLTQEIRNKADIGLHLDFTQFGDAYAHPVLIARSLLRSLPAQAIRLNIHRSEEHTSELQSQSNLVFRLLLLKKKNKEEMAFIGYARVSTQIQATPLQIA